MRKYNSDTDYPLILDAARKEGISITSVANALKAAGVEWPDLQSRSPFAIEVDRDICRAWKELGLHPKSPIV